MHRRSWGVLTILQGPLLALGLHLLLEEPSPPREAAPALGSGAVNLEVLVQVSVLRAVGIC